MRSVNCKSKWVSATIQGRVIFFKWMESLKKLGEYLEKWDKNCEKAVHWRKNTRARSILSKEKIGV